MTLLTWDRGAEFAVSPLSVAAQALSGTAFFEAWKAARLLDTHRKPMGATSLHQAEVGKLACPVMYTSAGFHAHQAGGQIGNESISLLRAASGRIRAGLPVSSTRFTAKTFLARSIPTVTMAMIFLLRQVDENFDRHRGILWS